MKVEDFNNVVETRFKHCRDLLVPKGHEYSRNGDRLHNFKSGSRIKGETPERALWGIWVKQLISVLDMIEDIEKDSHNLPSQKMIAEKFGDNINYLLLLEGLIQERIHQEVSKNGDSKI